MLFVDFVYNPKTGKAVTGEHYLKRGFMPSAEDVRTMLHLTYDNGDGTRCLEIKQYEGGTITFETSEGEAEMGDEQIDLLMNFLAQLKHNNNKFGSKMVSGEYEGPRRR